MNITELEDLILTRHGYLLVADCATGKTAERLRELLAIIDEEIRIKTLLKASGEQPCASLRRQ